MSKSSFRLKVKTFLVPTFDPAGKRTVLMLLGRASAEVEAAKYDVWMSYTPISVILMGLVLNCLERLAPCRAAPSTAASSALTFTATLSLNIGQYAEFGFYSETYLLSNCCFDSALNHWHSRGTSS